MRQMKLLPKGALTLARNRIVAAIAIGITALLLALSLWTWSSERLARAHWREAQAAQAARAVSTYGALLQTQAQLLAARGNPETGNSTFPGLESLQFVPLGKLGIADPAFDPGSLRNNIETRLVARAFNGETAGAEAYRDGERWLMIAAARLDAWATDTHGVLLLRADLGEVVREHLALTNEAGAFSLWARGTENFYRFVAQPGTTAAASTAPRDLAEADVRPLYAGFEPASALPTRVVMVNIIVALGGLSILLGLGALVLTSFRRLGTTIGSDAQRLGELVLHQRRATATLPVLGVTELVPLGETLLELASRQAVPTAADTSTSSFPAGILALDPLDGVSETAAVDDAIPEPQPSPPVTAPPELFRDYDIRGRAILISPELALAIGRAIGSAALDTGCTAIVVGVDGRDSSPRLHEQLVKGLLATGIDVIDVSTVATPMLYFACHHLGTQSGVMITGSHNPADHNGFKIMIGGETLRGEGIRALRDRITGDRFRAGQGSYRITTINDDYIRAVTEDVLVDGGQRIVIDCGNGAAATIAEDLFHELGYEVVPLHCTLDGRFPNHHPDPADPDNLRDLIGAVAEHQALLGIAFDGDGDRIGVVSATGAVVSADRLLMLFARELLSRHPGADVVFDVKCSRDLPAVIAENGGRPVMYRSGHSWIKEKMKETGALLGGEFTGHICFRDRWYGFDDALYCAARLLEILSSEGRSLDELLAELPQSVATPELRIPVDEKLKFSLMDTIASGIMLEGARIVHIDGVRAELADGWGLVRASNTSPALILRFEASDDQALERIQAAFRSELERLLPGMNMDF